MISTKWAPLTVAAISAMIAFSSCAQWFGAHSKSTRPETLFAVSAEQTPFYRYGPQQGHGPDRQLPKDTLVTVIRHSFAYSKVRLADGQQGFVANDDLSRASEHLIAQTTASSTNDEAAALPPTPEVKLPTADASPEFEPTPLPQPLMPQ
jgi:uncharacterized protein YgiM (DUF1202 family)